jgi:hypothetical protein
VLADRDEGWETTLKAREAASACGPKARTTRSGTGARHNAFRPRVQPGFDPELRGDDRVPLVDGWREEAGCWAGNWAAKWSRPEAS